MTNIITYPNNFNISIPETTFEYWYKNNGNNCVFIKNMILNSSPETYISCPGHNTIWEYDTVSYFMSIINKINNPVIIDVGAQIGLYSLLAKNYPTSKWHSFEPYKESFNLLNDNLKYNDITNVSTYNLALSNIKGKSFLHVPKKGSGRGGMNSLGSNIGRINPNLCDKVEINSDTIDNIFNNIKVDIIKIDVEGWELNVLLGGETIIKKYKPILLIEYYNKNMQTCGIIPQQLDSFLDKYNYKKIYDDSMGERVYISES